MLLEHYLIVREVALSNLGLAHDSASHPACSTLRYPDGLLLPCRKHEVYLLPAVQTGFSMYAVLKSQRALTLQMPTEM